MTKWLGLYLCSIVLMKFRGSGIGLGGWKNSVGEYTWCASWCHFSTETTWGMFITSYTPFIHFNQNCSNYICLVSAKGYLLLLNQDLLVPLQIRKHLLGWTTTRSGFYLYICKQKSKDIRGTWSKQTTPIFFIFDLICSMVFVLYVLIYLYYF